MKEYLSERQKEIVKILLENKEFVPVKNIADNLSLSRKTIYRELENIEKKIKMEKVQSKGIRLNITKKEKSELEEQIRSNKNILEKYSAKLRRLKILIFLLKISPKTSTIERFSKQYFVSKTSIVNDLKFIEKEVGKYNLKLTKTKKGTGITGDENDIRKALGSLINTSIQNENTDFEKLSDRIDEETIRELSCQFSKEDIANIEKILEKTEKLLNYTLADVYYVNILTHLLILLERMKKGEIKYNESKNEKYGITDKKIYEISKETARELFKLYNIELPMQEIYFIYQYLISSGVGILKKGEEDEFLETADKINLKIKKIVQDILKEFAKITKSDLKKDLYFYRSLILHIKAMLNRIEYKIEIYNPVSEQIKKEFFYTYKTVEAIMEKISRKYKFKKVSHSEIAYLTIYFQAAMENGKKIEKVVIVCSSGIGTSYLLKNRIKKVFPELEIQEVLSVNEIKNHYDLENTDLIISTVNIDDVKHIDKPIVYVSSILSKEDIETLNNNFVIESYNEKKENSEKSEKNICKRKDKNEIISKDMIKSNLDCRNKNEILETAGLFLKESGIIISEKKFFKEIEDREKIGSTNLRNGLAIPHVKSENVKKNKIILLRLNKKIKWNSRKEKVKAVILIVSKEINKKNEQKELEMITKITENLLEDKIIKIILNESDETVYKELKKISEN